MTKPPIKDRGCLYLIVKLMPQPRSLRAVSGCDGHGASGIEELGTGYGLRMGESHLPHCSFERVDLALNGNGLNHTVMESKADIQKKF